MIEFTVSSSMLMMPRKLPHSAWLGHIPFASWLLEIQRPRSIVELGTHRGASFLALCQAVEALQLTSRVYAVDTWAGDEHAGFYGNEIYAELRDYQQRHYAGISEMMRMRFDEAIDYFEDGTVDLLHIDGLHTYDAVKEDFESWAPKLSERAVVLFHDTCVHEREFGVWRYWREISSSYPSFEFTHTHGLGVLLVGPDRCERLLQLAQASAAGDFATVNHLFDCLGRNIKNVEEIERVNAGLAAAHAELGRVGQEQQRLVAENERFQASQEELSAERERLSLEAARLREVESSLREKDAQFTQTEQSLDGRLQESERQLFVERSRLTQQETRIHELEALLRDKEAQFLEAEQSINAVKQQAVEADGVRYARLEAELPKIVGTLSGLEQRLSETLSETREIVTEARELSVAAVVDVVLPRLEQQNAKFDQLLRPWWQRNQSK